MSRLGSLREYHAAIMNRETTCIIVACLVTRIVLFPVDGQSACYEVNRLDAAVRGCSNRRVLRRCLLRTTVVRIKERVSTTTCTCCLDTSIGLTVIIITIYLFIKPLTLLLFCRICASRFYSCFGKQRICSVSRKTL